jgi:putrescine transport system permease protein
MRKGISLFNVSSIVVGFAFLYLPIVILIVYSFNDSKLVTVWGGWSTRWYVALFHNEAFMSSAWITLRVAALSATLATILGTMAAIVLVRIGRFVSRRSVGQIGLGSISDEEQITQRLHAVALLTAAEQRGDTHSKVLSKQIE